MVHKNKNVKPSYKDGVSTQIFDELHRCIEVPNRYLLLVRWQTVEDHTTGFRRSPEYDQWKQLLHHFYDPFPMVEHFKGVLRYQDSWKWPKKVLRTQSSEFTIGNKTSPKFISGDAFTLLNSDYWVLLNYSSGWNWSFCTPHTGHAQSSGMFSKGVPGSTPPSGSPTSGSYS